MKVRVVFDDSSRREPYYYDFAELPRKGDVIAMPTPGVGPQEYWYDVDLVVLRPASATPSECVEIQVLRINPEP